MQRACRVTNAADELRVTSPERNITAVSLRLPAHAEGALLGVGGMGHCALWWEGTPVRFQPQ